MITIQIIRLIKINTQHKTNIPNSEYSITVVIVLPFLSSPLEEVADVSEVVEELPEVLEVPEVVEEVAEVLDVPEVVEELPELLPPPLGL